MAFGHDFYSFILTFAFCTLHFAFAGLRVFVVKEEAGMDYV